MGEVASSCSSLSLPRCLFWGRNNSEPLFCTVTPSHPHSCLQKKPCPSSVVHPSQRRKHHDLPFLGRHDKML